MAMAILHPQRAHRGGEEPHETKGGIFVYDGHPARYHDWEFRTVSKFNGAKSDDQPGLGSRVLEGLRGDAYLVALDMGADELSKSFAVPSLVERMKKAVFPHQETEAQELYHQGQKKGGALSRAPSEAMPA